MSSPDGNSPEASPAKSPERIRRYIVLGVDAGIACWAALDMYDRTQAPGPPIVWACVAAVIVFCTLTWMWQRQIRVSRTHDDGSRIKDARGERRSVAHYESAGFLARDLSPSLRRDVRAAAVSNVFSEYRLPHWHVLLTIASAIAAITVMYWGAMPPVNVFLPFAVLLLLGSSYTAMPRQMAQAYLRHGHCPSCAYRVVEVPKQADGCIVCPECGAAWRLPAHIPDVS